MTANVAGTEAVSIRAICEAASEMPGRHRVFELDEGARASHPRGHLFHDEKAWVAVAPAAEVLRDFA